MPKISLKNPDDPKKFLFFLPAAKIYLTPDQPGPVEIDEGKLSQQEIVFILDAVTENRITCDVLPKIKFTTDSIAKPMIDNTLPAAEKKTVPTLLSQLAENDEEKQNRLVKVLKRPLKEIQETIKKVEQPKDLRFLLDAERRGKNRKTITSSLTKRISIFEKAVIESLEEVPEDQRKRLPKSPLNIEAEHLEPESDQEAIIHLD